MRPPPSPNWTTFRIAIDSHPANLPLFVSGLAAGVEGVDYLWMGPLYRRAVDEAHSLVAARLPDEARTPKAARDVSKVLRPLHAVFVVGLRLVAAVVPPLGVNLAADDRNALVDEYALVLLEDFRQSFLELLALVFSAVSPEAEPPGFVYMKRCCRPSRAPCRRTSSHSG